MNNPNKKILVLADDLTGSNDTGVQFQRRGYRTTVMLPSSSAFSQKPRDTEVLIIDTESRFSTPEEAYEKVKMGAEKFSGDFDIVYKKIDSTMRGNIGIEVKAVVEALDASLVVMVPAFPAAGRTTNNGKCLVHGVPVHSTDLGADPRTPVKESDIGLAIKSQYDVKTISVKKENRENFFLDIINEGSHEHPLILIFDAENETDLQEIWALTADLREISVYSGSAGFAAYLGTETVKYPESPIFFVLGSVNQRSIDQACQLNETIEFIDIDILSVFEPNYEYIVEDLTHKIRSSLILGRHTALRTVWDRQQFERNIQLLQTEKNLSSHDIAEHIASLTAEICKRVVDQVTINKIFITGGDMAIHVLDLLGVATMDIRGEIAPGIPEATIQIGERKIQVITKAGGFGELDILQKVLEYWTTMNKEEKTK